MAESNIIKVLKDFGLTEKESEVYMFLAKRGAQKGGAISKSLKMHKAQVYHIMEVLQSKGLVTATLDFPTFFSPIPFEKAFELMIKTKKEETANLEAKKSELFGYWRSIRVEKLVSPSEKFTVIKGREKLYSKILQLIGEAKSEILAMSSSIDLVRSEQAGIIDAAEKRKIRFKILTSVSKEDVRIIKEVIETILFKSLQIEARHKDFNSKAPPRFIIKDKSEVVFFLTPADDLSVTSRMDVGLWTNSKEIVGALSILFDASWDESTNITERLSTFENGTVPVETVIIKSAEIAHRKFSETLDEAAEELIMVTTSKSLIDLLETSRVRKWADNNVKVSILVPMDLESVNIAEQLSENLQIRYSDAAFAGMAVVDRRHLFMFKIPPSDIGIAAPVSYFNHMLYTNDIEYVERINDLLVAMWNKSSSILGMKTGEAMRSSPVRVLVTDSVVKVIYEMLANNIGAVVVVEGERPVGIITEEDVLNRMVKNGRTPEKTFAKEIMSAPLVTVDREKTLFEALTIMKAKKIRRLAVVENGKLVGLLTERRALAKTSMVNEFSPPKNSLLPTSSC